MDTLIRRPRIDPKFATFKLAIRKSKIHRYGVYAEERIPANRKVIEYTGERLNRRETKRRGEGEYTYLFTLDKYWTLDGAFGGSGAEIINHSCEPNVVSRIMKGHVIYMSLRTIEPRRRADRRLQLRIRRRPNFLCLRRPKMPQRHGAHDPRTGTRPGQTQGRPHGREVQGRV